MTLRRFLVLAAGGLGLVAVVFAAGILGGVKLQRLRDKPTSVVAKTENKIRSYLAARFRDDTAEVRRLNTNRVQLREETVFMPVDAAERAGGIAAVPGGVLILDREGRLFLAEDAVVTRLPPAVPENNVAALRAAHDSGQLGDIEIRYDHFRYNDILHVDDGAAAYLLVSFTEWHAAELCFTSTLARLDIAPGSRPRDWRAAAEDWEIVKRTAPCLPPLKTGRGINGLEAGGRMVPWTDGTVLWSSGAYERDDRYEGRDFSGALAQDDATDYGKLMVVDPVAGVSRTIAKGLRNPQGLTVDARGRAWVTDHGMRAGDELNLVFEGANFGWPAVTYGKHYDGRPAGNREFHANHDGYDQPAVAFVPSIAPGAALALDGFHYAWDGDILVGGFVGSLFRAHIEEGRAVYTEPIPLGVRTRDLAMLEDGRIAVWTDNRRLIYLSVATEPDAMAVFADRIASLTPDTQASAVSDLFGQCAQCHALAEGAHGSGPSLYGVCGRAPGSAPGYDGYSGALGGLGGTWTADRLTQLITDPESLVQDSTMAWPGTEDAAAARALAGLLCRDGDGS